jgi:capsular polysaccharide biosynthesis protein
MTPRGPRETPPQVCLRLAELAAREGGEWTPFAEPARVRYALPARASAEVLEYLRPLAEATPEPTGTARLPTGRVFGDGAVLSADGRAVARDVSHDFGRSFDEHWLLGYDDLRVPETLAGATAVVAVNLGAGYCHWLLEELPRLLLVGPGEVENLILHAGLEPARAALTRRGGRERLVEARRTAHRACAPLLVPALAGRPGLPTAAALELITDFTDGLGRGASAYGEKIYVSRAKAGRRRVSNEAELEAALAAAGFATVRAEELSWAEQIAVFRAARVVVGPHGAGLANLVFCAPGTRVVELAHAEYFNPTFWRLAALRGLDYRPLATPAGRAVGEERRANRLDIEADVAAVLAACGA